MDAQVATPKKKITFFLFINSKSGGEKGKKYLTVPNRKLSFQYTHDALITLYLFDLFCPSQMEKGLQKLNKLASKLENGQNRQLKVIICGGDGTVIYRHLKSAQNKISIKKSTKFTHSRCVVINSQKFIQMCEMGKEKIRKNSKNSSNSHIFTVPFRVLLFHTMREQWYSGRILCEEICKTVRIDKYAQRKYVKMCELSEQFEFRLFFVQILPCPAIWVVELIAKAGINTDSLVFSIIPIGTGNDFSRCLGWGGSPIGFSDRKIHPLKARIVEWLTGEESWFDIWTVELNTYEDGTIFQIRNKQQADSGLQKLNRGFCNYFGVGTDARICYSVQLRRQKNKWLNLALYGCIGCCKLFKKIRSTHEAVDEFMAGELEEEEGREVEKQANEDNQAKISDMLVKGNRIQLSQGFGSILALNSIRYMAGLKNVWNTSKMGIRGQPPEPFTSQKFDDGKIQFIAFKNELSLGLERFINSGARVAQGSGPFSLSFKRTATDTPTFLHIDGQAIKVRQLKSVVIKKNEFVKSSRIRVLIKREEE